MNSIGEFTRFFTAFSKFLFDTFSNIKSAPTSYVSLVWCAYVYYSTLPHRVTRGYIHIILKRSTPRVTATSSSACFWIQTSHSFCSYTLSDYYALWYRNCVKLNVYTCSENGDRIILRVFCLYDRWIFPTCNHPWGVGDYWFWISL